MKKHYRNELQVKKKGLSLSIVFTAAVNVLSLHEGLYIFFASEFST